MKQNHNQREKLKMDKARFSFFVRVANDGFHHPIPEPKLHSMKLWFLDYATERNMSKHSEEECNDFIKGAFALGVIDDYAFKLFFERQYKEFIERERINGVRCPCCEQNVKEYKRSLSSNSAKFLGSLVQLHIKSIASGGDGWIHYKECEFSSRDYPSLAWWRLAETQVDHSRKKRTSGMWAPTPTGISFVIGRLKVHKHLYTYNGKVTKLDESAKMVSYQDICGNHFNYDELMSNHRGVILSRVGGADES